MTRTKIIVNFLFSCKRKKIKNGMETPDGTRTRNPSIRSRVPYPIGPRGHIPNKGLEPLATRLKVWRSTN